MRKFVIPAIVLAAASIAAPSFAQSRHYDGPRPPAYHNAGHGGWQSISQRQATLERRIDQGVRSGQLTRREASRLRSEFNAINRLEANYRRNGLSPWERADLDRRYDRLSAQIRYERNDREVRFDPHSGRRG